MKKIISSLLVLPFVSMNFALGASNYSYTQNSPMPQYEQNYYPSGSQYVNSNNKTLKGRVVTVPSGQIMNVISTAPLSSQNAYLGQVYSVTLASDLYSNGSLIAPAGSAVMGSVVEVTHAKHGSLNGKLSIRFSQINTPNGSQIPISAIIKTNDNTGVLVGGTKMDVAKEYGKDAVAGAAIGALSGIVFGALAGGSIGRGAALGTAVGAGGGVVKSVIDKGVDVNIPAGANFEIQLTQPITVSPAVAY